MLIHGETKSQKHATREMNSVKLASEILLITISCSSVNS